MQVTRSKIVSGGGEYEVMTGDDQDDTSPARLAVVDARRDAAMAQARLADAAVRYADARIAGDTAAGVGLVGVAAPNRASSPPMSWH